MESTVCSLQNFIVMLKKNVPKCTKKQDAAWHLMACDFLLFVGMHSEHMSINIYFKRVCQSEINHVFLYEQMQLCDRR